MSPTVEKILNVLGLDVLLRKTPWQLIAQIEKPEVLIQIVLVVLTGVAAFWLARRERRILIRLIERFAPKMWAPDLLRAASKVAPPLTWLIVLWIAGTIARASGFAFGIVGAVTSLLTAWVFIRVMTFAVRNQFVANLIAVVAWAIAALSILHLLGPLTHQLDQSAIVLGKIRLSALTVVRAIFVLAVLLWMTTVLTNFLERRISHAETLTPSLQALLIQVMRLLLPTLAVVAALAMVGVDLTALTVFSGAVGIGVGLGLQRTVANLVAGLSLIIGKMIKPGDVIAYNDTYGWVTSMGARFVALRTRDGIEHLVPNDEFLQKGVENWSYSDNRLRLRIPVGIAYESDVRQAIGLCVEAAAAVDRVLRKPEPLCLVKEFGDSSVNLEVRAWIDDPQNGVSNVKSEILLGIWDRFAGAGIRIPFPQRDLHLVSVPKEGIPLGPPKFGGTSGAGGATQGP